MHTYTHLPSNNQLPSSFHSVIFSLLSARSVDIPIKHLLYKNVTCIKPTNFMSIQLLPPPHHHHHRRHFQCSLLHFTCFFATLTITKKIVVVNSLLPHVRKRNTKQDNSNVYTVIVNPFLSLTVTVFISLWCYAISIILKNWCDHRRNPFFSWNFPSWYLSISLRCIRITLRLVFTMYIVSLTKNEEDHNERGCWWSSSWCYEQWKIFYVYSLKLGNIKKISVRKYIFLKFFVLTLLCCETCYF